MNAYQSDLRALESPMILQGPLLTESSFAYTSSTTST